MWTATPLHPCCCCCCCSCPTGRPVSTAPNPAPTLLDCPLPDCAQVSQIVDSVGDSTILVSCTKGILNDTLVGGWEGEGGW